MGVHTMRYKLVTWAMSAFFIGVAGGISAFQLISFEPLESAYQTINLGIFMVVCVLLGGKGTLWGADHWRHPVPDIQRSDVELFPWLAMGCARRTDCGHGGLLPGWIDGLAPHNAT